jgi:uncharacterized protein
MKRQAMQSSKKAKEVSERWRLSSFTRVIKDDAGNILLHNSFMGSIARVAGEKKEIIEPLLEQEFKYSAFTKGPVRELCDAGFFIPVKIKERDLVGEILEKESKIGFHAIILPHENCNFRCDYCYEKFERGKMRPDIAEGLKIFIHQKTKDNDRLSIAWFGGEPLLARDVIYHLSASFMKSCEKNGASYSSGITTNGYLLTNEVVDSLLKHKVFSYQVTIDGPEELHDRSRKLAGGKGTYQRIIMNLKNMKKRTEDFLVKIRINFTKHHTSESMEEFFVQVQSLFQGDARFDLHFHPVGRWGGPNDANLDVCDVRSVGEVRSAFMRRSLQLGFPNQMAKRHLRPHGNVCYAGKENSIVIGSDGTIYKCTVAFDDAVNQVGKLLKNGEILIDQHRWNLWTKLKDKNIDKCQTCSFSPTCQSKGCPLMAIKKNEPPCPITMEEYERTVKLIADVS